MVDVALVTGHNFATSLLMEFLEALTRVRKQEADLNVALSRWVNPQALVLTRLKPSLVLFEDHPACHGRRIWYHNTIGAICIFNRSELTGAIDSKDTESARLDAR